MEKKKVSVMMKFKSTKVHSVRYDPEDKNNTVLAGLYLLNDAFNTLGEPQRIEVSVERKE